MSAPDVVEGLFGFPGLHAFLRLVHHQQIEGEPVLLLPLAVVRFPGHPVQLVVLPAEENGALQILQGNKGDHALIHVILEIFVPRQHAGLAPEGVGAADKAELLTPADELVEILRPGVGDAGPVGNDQDAPKAHADDQIIGGEGLAEARLRVPEELRPALAEPVRRRGDGCFLLRPQRIGEAGLALRGAAGGKGVKVRPRLLTVHMEPFGFGLALHMGDGAEIVVKVVVRKRLPAAVLVNGIVPPEDAVGDVGGVVLLPDPVLHALLFRVPDLRPALMGRVVGVGVGVDHRDNGLKGADIGGHGDTAFR